jgi:hypothetical protein
VTNSGARRSVGVVVRPTLAFLFVGGLVALTLSACGDGDESDERVASRVEVMQLFEPPVRLGIAGSRSFAVLEDRDGEIARVVAAKHDFDRNLTPLLDERLAPGEYQVTSFQRRCRRSPCRGGADGLGPPRARCVARFEVDGRMPIDVVITVDPEAAKCTIETGFVELG